MKDIMRQKQELKDERDALVKECDEHRVELEKNTERIIGVSSLPWFQLSKKNSVRRSDRARPKWDWRAQARHSIQNQRRRKSAPSEGEAWEGDLSRRLGPRCCWARRQKAVWPAGEEEGRAWCCGWENARDSDRGRSSAERYQKSRPQAHQDEWGAFGKFDSILTGSNCTEETTRSDRQVGRRKDRACLRVTHKRRWNIDVEKRN